MLTTPLTLIIPCNKPQLDYPNIKRICLEARNTPINIIIVIDSPDVASKMPDKYLNLISSRILVVSGNYGSPGLARNAGVNSAQSEWVCFSDADDAPNVLNLYLMAKQIQDTSYDLAIGNIKIIDKNTQKETEYISNSELKSIYIMPAFTRMIFRRSWVQSIAFTDIKIAEDIVFLDRYLRGNPVVFFSGINVYTYFIDKNDRKLKYADCYDDILVALDLIDPRNITNKNLKLFRSIHTLSLLKFMLANNNFNSKKRMSSLHFFFRLRLSTIVLILYLKLKSMIVRF